MPSWHLRQLPTPWSLPGLGRVKAPGRPRHGSLRAQHPQEELPLGTGDRRSRGTASPSARMARAAVPIGSRLTRRLSPQGESEGAGHGPSPWAGSALQPGPSPPAPPPPDPPEAQGRGWSPAHAGASETRDWPGSSRPSQGYAPPSGTQALPELPGSSPSSGAGRQATQGRRGRPSWPTDPDAEARRRGGPSASAFGRRCERTDGGRESEEARARQTPKGKEGGASAPRAEEGGRCERTRSRGGNRRERARSRRGGRRERAGRRGRKPRRRERAVHRGRGGHKRAKHQGGVGRERARAPRR